MRFMANENIPATAIQLLRQSGHDVLSVKECSPGAGDATVMQRARDEGRILITQDKDFGELAFRTRAPAPVGFVLFRLTGADPDADSRRIAEVLNEGSEWPGHFAVVTDLHVRLRPLPDARR